ncbi:PAS domain-containing sensor histidine kinase [Caulobacter sp. 17J80-11]|uniref:hybrid sensor histidine kinase/response regulator n=1 Tax=Caulobacter sp. 17J80-11 TaxID=2763502 RepID=UPI0016537A8C|nr:PAS domain-containing sensor histidine kinase [Caulobacter sp. 17J80-11]MBC6980372.1 PAS domain-containing protein [Caulobacter sp. 17J80-11]
MDEAPLQVRGGLFLGIAEASQNALAVLRRDGRVTFMNRRGLDLLQAGELAGIRSRSWYSLWPAEHAAAAQHAVETAAAGQTKSFRVFLAVETGAPRWWDTVVSPVFDRAGRVIRVLTQSRDVTAEIETQSFLDTIIDHVPAVLYAKDARSGRYVLMNQAAERMFGVERDDVLGRTDADLMPGRLAALRRRLDQSVVRSGRVHLEEMEIPVANGAKRRFRGRSLATYGDEGARHIIGVAEDVTDEHAAAEALKAALEHAESANRAKSEFLANMSHEIRTPLNGVVGVADVLARTQLSPAQREMVELIRASGETLERLLSEVLDLARVESGQVEIQVEPFHLGDALRSVAGLLALRAEEKGVAFRVDIPAEADAWVLGDAVRVKQILTNLLSNAVKFTEWGEVRLKAACDADGAWRFEVSDTGVGFDAADKERVFGRFQQADGSITRRFGGTGLGLAISRQLAELMGGDLDCDSTPGEGSNFTLHLSLAEAETPRSATSAQEALEEPTGADDRPLRVLLADDHPTNRKVVELILDQVGVEMVSVENGQEALDAFRELPAFDLVLMDMQMPFMDGLTATREIRRWEAQQGLPRTPIHMLTANALAEHLEAGRAAGADRHLAKPIAADRLIAALAEAAEIAEARQAA